MKLTIQHIVGGVLLAIATLCHAAPVTWQPVRNVAGDTDVATNGRVIKAYTFASGNAPMVNGVSFQYFADQSSDKITLGMSAAGGYKNYYKNSSLSTSYNQLLAGGMQDMTNLEAPMPQQIILNDLVPGRIYQVQLWVADNRTWPDLTPAFSSQAETVRGSGTDANIPTLRWQGGPEKLTAQYVIGTFTANKAKQTLTLTPIDGFFKGHKWLSAQINALVVSDLSPGIPIALAMEAKNLPALRSLDECNVVWDSPSGNSFGSMPLGNGDVGLNVWVESTGDLVFYISKVNAYDANHMLRKLGCVRLRLQPPLDVNDFQQTLVLRDGAVEIKGGDVSLNVWVDANQPVVRVQGSSDTPRQATLIAESLRPLQNADVPLPTNGTAAVLFNDQADRLAWCYRNRSSVWATNFALQNTPEMVAKTKDPILHRTSGCVLQAADFIRSSPMMLASRRETKTFDCSVRILSSQPESVSGWLAEAEKPVKSDWAAHQAWWRMFWNRSHIFVTSCGEGEFNLDQCRFTQFPQGAKAYEGHKNIDPALNAFQISQRYALERFCEAAASRGEVPPPYNGSIFTMDMPGGLPADARDWAELTFMWQNTRQPYWSMPTRGDYDTIVPGMEFVRDGLEIGRDRCQKLLGLGGAFIMEASWWHNVGVQNWETMQWHLRYHQLATIELPAIMAETYEHTRDSRFLKEVLLPCADAGIEYYANRFAKRDARGKMLMEGVGCAETYQGVKNPCTEIGGLKFLLAKLLSFDIDDTRRAKWSKLLEEMPGVPVRRIRGMDLLAVGEVYGSGREICESPELYSIYPFRQVWLGNTGLLANARQSFHVRNVSLDGTDDNQAVETGGWQSAPVQAAHLGLAREAARLASINFNDKFIDWTDNVDPNAPFPNRPQARFPAFWERKMDGTPDNDHGANSVNTLQSMLLQNDGRKIFLLPAWPENWDVSFKLCANDNTTVECVYRQGQVQSIKVTPTSRRRDVVDFSTLENRVRNLVEVACADRNYLFGLPPMLDGLPQSGPTTGPWLARYGECFAGTKAGPWPLCLFKGKTLYAFAFNEAVLLPDVPAKVMSQKNLTAGSKPPVSIMKLEYDQPLDEIAQATPSTASLTIGRTGSTVDLGGPKTFDRLEFTIENPGHLRAQGKPFELQVRQSDGSWRTVHQGRVFGTIYSKRFPEVTAQNVRLAIDAPIRQFDLFSPGK